jgi:hypothetical protein
VSFIFSSIALVRGFNMVDGIDGTATQDVDVETSPFQGTSVSADFREAKEESTRMLLAFVTGKLAEYFETAEIDADAEEFFRNFHLGVVAEEAQKYIEQRFQELKMGPLTAELRQHINSDLFERQLKEIAEKAVDWIVERLQDRGLDIRLYPHLLECQKKILNVLHLGEALEYGEALNDDKLNAELDVIDQQIERSG